MQAANQPPPSPSLTNVSVPVETRHRAANKSKRLREPRFELSASQLADLRHAFDLLDSDNAGCIAPQDLKVAISALGFEPSKSESAVGCRSATSST